jgi:hypothetical protein
VVSIDTGFFQRGAVEAIVMTGRRWGSVAFWQDCGVLRIGGVARPACLLAVFKNAFNFKGDAVSPARNARPRAKMKGSFHEKEKIYAKTVKSIRGSVAESEKKISASRH